MLPDGTTNFRLSNVGSVQVRGVEVETAYRASRNLTVNASVAYLDAMITDFSDAQCYPGQTVALGCIAATTTAPIIPAHQNLANTDLPQAPKWKLTTSFDYARPINGGALTLLLRGAYTYQSEINYALTHDPQVNMKGYGVINLSAGVRDPSKRWELIAFVNNLGGEKYYAGLVNSQSGYGNQQALQAIIPRDFKTYGGVRLTVHY